jgi:hypothetical protein
MCRRLAFLCTQPYWNVAHARGLTTSLISMASPRIKSEVANDKLKKQEDVVVKNGFLKKFVGFVNKTEGRDKFGKIIQFWSRAASYFTRNVSSLRVLWRRADHS